MSENKQYDSVPELVQDTAGSEFAEFVEKRIAERQLVKRLQILRAEHRVSQEDMAGKLGCSQSRVSKLESGKDADIRIGDFLAYIDALGLQAQILLFKKGVKVSDQVKFHFFETKALVKKLAGLACHDEDMAKGIASFFNDACFNFVTMLVQCAKELPQAAQAAFPLIRLIDEVAESQTDEKKPKVKHAHNSNGVKTNGVMAKA